MSDKASVSAEEIIAVKKRLSIFHSSIRFVDRSDETRVHGTKVSAGIGHQIFRGIKNRIKNHGKGAIIPTQFRRKPSPQAPYSTFAPICIEARSDSLKRGFPLVYFPQDLSRHDVPPADWASFVHDINLACTNNELINASVGKLMNFVSLGFISGYIVGAYVEKLISHMEHPIIEGVISMWNSKYFQPRGLRLFFFTPEDVQKQREAAITNYLQQSGVSGGFSKFIKEREWKKHHRHVSKSKFYLLIMCVPRKPVSE
ncbi:hypothetical protein SJAG_00162 [Schizosaccharomyces japonicus yFS275]|uniref:Uncharacterized protein n=1 Tax=Schizosaccharomyces japonicus (strain yFS275 / FY16936) TaxID=402676 RepID=B6JXM2_SCHJY|nr:hypothetical protein SJAG_00162 [Schizosaccharomyces japonicus yFS275]EEB05166.1 hypothetical protein SJAG_00162 [Schizosaccharomyces japonicus yFS275]